MESDVPDRPESSDHTTLMHLSFDPSPMPKPFRLVVVEGPDAGKTFALDGSQPSRLLIGTSPACDIVVSDRTVSRRHAALDLVGSGVRVTDLGSRNGTSIDGLRIEDAYTEGGELVRLGSTSFRLEREKARSVVPLSTRTSFGRVIGASTEMRRFYPLCEKLANSDVPVIIEGETGTGKEVLAESLHEEGTRKAGPFVVLDCTAVPPNLLEAELFGHERGAFTGAVASRRGVFEQANHGTLLIDEIGELDPMLQPKLLRAIERREVRPIGSNRSISVDVRLLAATRRDLDREVQAGRFRDDLLHRLAVARIELPPLKRRRGDIPLLARHFCKDLNGDERFLTKELLLSWEDHPWQGNVRELRNTVARHVALGELANISFASGDGVTGESSGEPNLSDDFLQHVLELPLGEARQKVVEEFERRYVHQLLARHDGNVTRAAQSAGVARRYLQILKARTLTNR
jgi:two-component system response regulator HydG